MSFCIVPFDAFALERERAHADAAGEVVSVHGTVFVRQDAEGKGGPISLKPGNNVYAGDVINTSSEGAIKILLKDKSIVDLGPSSLFKVDQFKANEGGNRQVELDMKFGRLRVSVSKKITGSGKFNVKTRAATMGVRGTEFVVNSSLGGDFSSGRPEAPKTDVTVLQGKVDVQAPSASGTGQQTTSLLPGNQISTQVGTATAAVVKLDQNQMASVASVGKVADNTFAKAITIEPKQENNSSQSSSSSSASSTRSPASNGGAGGSSGGAADAPIAGSLQSAVANIAAAAPAVPVSFSELGVPGAPSIVNVTTSPVNQVNRSYRVSVIVSQ